MKQGVVIFIRKQVSKPEDKIKDIIKTVEEYYGVDTSVKTRKRPVVFARFAIMYLLIKFTSLGVCAAASIYNMDHSSAVYAKRVIIDLCDTDPEIKRQIIELETLIGQ